MVMRATEPLCREDYQVPLKDHCAMWRLRVEARLQDEAGFLTHPDEKMLTYIGAEVTEMGTKGQM